MKAKTRTVSAIAFIMFSLTSPDVGFVPAEPAIASHPAEPSVTVHRANPVLEQRLDWALGRFTHAGLELPPLDVTFHDGAASCDGHRGLYRLVDGIADIEICTTTDHVILHEIAHAWVETNLNADHRSIWMDYWGLDTWNRQDIDWSLRGNEKAADAIAYALGRIPSDPADSLLKYLCGYQLLTGDPLPTTGDEAVADECERLTYKEDST